MTITYTVPLGLGQISLDHPPGPDWINTRNADMVIINDYFTAKSKFRLRDGTEDATIEVGTGGSGNRNALIDLVGDDTYTDFGLRLIRANTGANAISQLRHHGTGALQIFCDEDAGIQFWTSGDIRIQLTAGNLGTRFYRANAPGQYNELLADGTANYFSGVSTEVNKKPLHIRSLYVAGGAPAGASGIQFYTGSTAAPTLRAQIAEDGSVVVGNPTGGAKGAGTINAVSVFDDNVLLSDQVFESNYALLPIGDMKQFYETHLHLPTIKGRAEWDAEGKFSLGALATMLWETVEVQARYIADLHERLTALEAR